MVEVVKFTSARAEIIKSVITTLEDALNDARAGQIVAVSIAFVRPDGAINTSRSACDNLGLLLGAATLAQGRMIASANSR